jgi:hypothetical protein
MSEYHISVNQYFTIITQQTKRIFDVYTQITLIDYRIDVYDAHVENIVCIFRDSDNKFLYVNIFGRACGIVYDYKALDHYCSVEEIYV